MLTESGRSDGTKRWPSVIIYFIINQPSQLAIIIKINNDDDAAGKSAEFEDGLQSPSQ